MTHYDDLVKAIAEKKDHPLIQGLTVYATENGYYIPAGDNISFDGCEFKDIAEIPVSLANQKVLDTYVWVRE
jgi:hypothetical protein